MLPLASDAGEHARLMVPLVSAYIASVTAAPAHGRSSRAQVAACELCARDWVPLTYHHLVPRAAHARVRKRGWHGEERLQSVAWLCRACHSFVHGLAGNEELARRFYTVELIREGGTEREADKRERVERWVRWVGGVRWKSR